MKTKSIILLSKKLEAMVHAINDDIPSHQMQETVDYYRRATNVFGFIIYESMFNWILHREYTYDREIVKQNVTDFQWVMLTSIEKKYLNIILKNDRVYSHFIETKIDLEKLPLN